MRSTVQICYPANNILLMRSWKNALVWKVADRFPGMLESEQLLNSVFAKYRDSVSVSQIDPLATDKSRYFAQPGPINKLLIVILQET